MRLESSNERRNEQNHYDHLCPVSSELTPQSAWPGCKMAGETAAELACLTHGYLWNAQYPEFMSLNMSLKHGFNNLYTHSGKKANTKGPKGEEQHLFLLKLFICAKWVWAPRAPTLGCFGPQIHKIYSTLKTPKSNSSFKKRKKTLWSPAYF